MARKKSTDWVYDGEYVTTVDSENEPGKTYDIHRLRGALVCDCASFRFSTTPKDCKHLKAHRGEGKVIGVTTEATRIVVATKKGTETLVLRKRRAISFTDI